MRTRRKFDAQFKREAVELARNANVTKKQVSGCGQCMMKNIQLS